MCDQGLGALVHVTDRQTVLIDSALRGDVSIDSVLKLPVWCGCTQRAGLSALVVCATLVCVCASVCQCHVEHTHKHSRQLSLGRCEADWQCIVGYLALLKGFAQAFGA
jgi:hypothetical protein